MSTSICTPATPIQGDRVTKAINNPWLLSWRADPVAKILADRHYSRQSPESKQFVPPGQCVVLRTLEGNAYWVASWPLAQYVRHAWPGAWICSAFRNESYILSSYLITCAVAVTRNEFGDPPGIGMITFVDEAKVKRKRDPGRCFLKAGFRFVGYTKGGLVALQLTPDRMPAPEAVADLRRPLFGVANW